MGWQDSFVPDQAVTPPPVPQSGNWQSSFVPDDQGQQASQQQPQQNYLPGEAQLRQVGLTGRDLMEVTGETPGFIADIPNKAINLGSKGINSLFGTSIPMMDMPSQALGISPSQIEGYMNAAGIPQPQGDLEEGVNGAAKFAVGVGMGGEGALNQIKQAYGNGAEMLGKALAKSEDTGLIVPKSSDIKLIKEKLELAGITPQQYAEALKNSSPEDFAGEVGGDPLRLQTQVQAKIAGPSMQPARDAMRQRLETAPQRVQNIIENTFYPSSSVLPTVGADATIAKGSISPLEPVQQLQQHLVDIKDKLPQLYDAANQSSVAGDASLGIISTPAGQKAMNDTVTKLANQGIKPEEAGIVIDPDNGFHGLSPQVPVSTLHDLSKSLGDQVVRNPLTGAIEDSQSNVVEGLRKNITSYLSQNSPQFNTANANAAAQLQGQSAFDMGRKLAHSAAGEKSDALMDRAAETFSPQELSFHKAGYAQGLSDSLQGSPLGGGNPASRIAKNMVQTTTANILQSPTEAQKFANALLQEKNRIDLAQRGLFGSNTAETLDSGVPKIPTSITEAGAHAFMAAKDWLMKSRNERLASLLYATDPETKAVLAQKVLQK